ncbi:aspartate--tRNA ligase [Afifella marina]|uniref:Aspartate--tRNA(Asp/Asn) ligase n=1 Tax=Afifella marina DSM 2698 TaxID=1120955 RepID=A0A1G5NK38_AFIMA|nr:aspartate--tRNA ligase [Afifella marina]MBK1623554.1 aspartate--tRNA ligase [Afifella marina DSM 2698]MBK1626547.1 aspartate--tRNA ligase [Afifella marina]MBK5916096.1 aspartate--tRNA ligase [Afifella marina]RAI21700.1 aspartate--tRNA ligase [Afifella marina DSM 2698]SCZ37121.1 aspartyl-tRNA synthetase [Afifella marina DSM 2698]
MHRYRSHHCGALRASDVGENVRLSGWVHRVRDHGGLLFIDLRDHYGLTQIVADPDSPAFTSAEKLRAEWCVRIDGEVKARAPEVVNPNLPTGEIEVFANEIEILSEAPELPLPVFGEPEYPEDTRLRYRFLDLRRDTLHKNIMKRSAVISRLRELMGGVGFNEFQTPILTASSPEGARDFLVPSRIHPGKFYALPQAPQQFKQLIMVAGFDRYFQIAPCFRDEDPRADRLPGEFYQLDIEMSFVTQDDVFAAMEPVMRGIFESFADGREVTQVFPRIAYADAIRKYGTDKPDLRNPIEMQAVTQHFAGSGFKVFAGMIERDPKVEVWAIPAPGGGSRAFCDRMNSWAQGEGQPGLGYIFFRNEADKLTGAGPVAKNIGEERTEAIRSQLGLKEGDAVFFVAGNPKIFADFAGKARDRAGRELNLIDENRFALAWIVDFPMYEWDDEEKKVDFSHNPFSMPQGGLEALETKDPLTIPAYQYDCVCNGYEIASGAIRNHKAEIMKKAFAIAGYPEEVLEEKFGGMLRALQYGAPPHGGMAAGIDRIVMLLVGAKNLREVTMFPMNQQALDLLMGAPSSVTPKQLRELSIRVTAPQD